MIQEWAYFTFTLCLFYCTNSSYFWGFLRQAWALCVWYSVRWVPTTLCFLIIVQASDFRDELILHTREREGLNHWQYHKVVALHLISRVTRVSPVTWGPAFVPQCQMWQGETWCFEQCFMLKVSRTPWAPRVIIAMVWILSDDSILRIRFGRVFKQAPPVCSIRMHSSSTLVIWRLIIA